MARVALTGSLKRLTGGDGELELEANVRQLDARGAEHYRAEAAPGKGMAVAIDGQIYQDAWLQLIGPDSEVHLLLKIAGESPAVRAVWAL